MAEAAVATVKPRTAAKAVVWKWSGKTKQGETRAGEMEAGDVDRGRGAPAADGHRARQGEEEAEGDPPHPAGVRRGDDQGHPGLHPAVLGHDRRRPAAGPGARHHRHPGRQPGLPQGAAGGQVAGRVGLHLRRRAGGAPQGLRRALRAAGPGRRGRRHPRHHPAAARRLHREEREAEAAGEGRHGLPGHRPDRGGGGGGRPHRLRGPDLREDVQGLRRRPPGGHPVPGRPLQGLPQRLVPLRRRPHRPLRRLQGGDPPGQGPGDLARHHR